jgi:hypothetical protein
LRNKDECPTYKELAVEAKVANATTGQGLKLYLDEVGEFCRSRGFPDLAVIVVSKSSRDTGNPLPSRNAFDDEGFYGHQKLSVEGVKAEQRRVRDYDWASEVWIW